MTYRLLILLNVSFLSYTADKERPLMPSSFGIPDPRLKTFVRLSSILEDTIIVTIHEEDYFLVGTRHDDKVEVKAYRYDYARNRGENTEIPVTQKDLNTVMTEISKHYVPKLVDFDFEPEDKAPEDKP